MDISPIYLKMCEAAEEVQAAWKDHHWGDFVSYDNGDMVHALIAVKDTYENRNDYTFLPRQDQLQSMVYHKHPRWIGLLLFFGDWLADETSSEDETSTPEQLWLRYTMNALYNKHWDNKRNEWMFEKKESKNED